MYGTMTFHALSELAMRWFWMTGAMDGVRPLCQIPCDMLTRLTVDLKELGTAEHWVSLGKEVHNLQ